MIGSLQELVRLSSVSPKYPGVEYRDHVGREGEASGLMVDLYRRADATVETFAVEAGRDNAVARLGGAGPGNSLVFNGHVEVVPVGNVADWTLPPFAGEIVDSRMYGSGTTDQKSGLVAQAYAGSALNNAGLKLAGELQLQDSRNPSITNVSSTWGLGGVPGFAAYCAPKAGIIGLTRAVAADCGPFGIRVNAVSPGYVAKNMGSQTDQEPKEQVSTARAARDRQPSFKPLARQCDVGEIAATVVFLSSADASFITGAVLPVDGGQSARLNTGEQAGQAW